MKLSGIPGALVLGLLASLVAHTVLFGGEHAMGGAYSALMIELAAAGCASLLAFFGALAWSGASGVADGSILASRLAKRLPGAFPAAAATGVWYALGERAEAAHLGPGALVTIAALLASAWLLLALARAAVRLLAQIVVAIVRTTFAQRTPVWTRSAPETPFVLQRPSLRRRFVRPPPVGNALA